MITRATLDGLKKVGFKLNYGHEGGGFLSLTRRRGGGYYLDVGASQLVIDGKIKLKNDSRIKRYTKTGFEFEDGSTFDADVILFATGYARLSSSPLPSPFHPTDFLCMAVAAR